MAFYGGCVFYVFFYLLCLGVLEVGIKLVFPLLDLVYCLSVLASQSNLSFSNVRFSIEVYLQLQARISRRKDVGLVADLMLSSSRREGSLNLRELGLRRWSSGGRMEGLWLVGARVSAIHGYVGVYLRLRDKEMLRQIPRDMEMLRQIQDRTVPVWLSRVWLSRWFLGGTFDLTGRFMFCDFPFRCILLISSILL